MRLPTYEELSDEQDAVYLMAPLDGATLVSGPPGTGKTVIAFYRAEAVARKGRTPKVVMYNNVLHRYTRNASTQAAVQQGVRTWWSWYGHWWTNVFGGRSPEIKPWHPDWQRVLERVFTLAADPAALQRASNHWGHLIVDEGQDFGKGFYQTAAVLLHLGQSGGTHSHALTVLADENQRLQADLNSCLDDIRGALSLDERRHYKLTRNYRNTLQVARVAASFYCGLPTGVPELPEGRRGPLPRLHGRSGLDDAVEFMVRFVENHRDLEVAVFLPNGALQVKYYNKLAYRLGLAAPGVVVQMYRSSDRGGADKLRFDAPGTVTVLCDQSAKGLEFDAVFIPDLESRRWDPAAIDQMRMQFYVLCSRARTHLHFLHSGEPGSVPILDYFPQKGSGLLEWG